VRKGAKKGRRGVEGGVAGINFRHEVGRRGGHGETREEASGKGGARVGKVEGRERGVAGAGEREESGEEGHTARQAERLRPRGGYGVQREEGQVEEAQDKQGRGWALAGEDGDGGGDAGVWGRDE